MADTNPIRVPPHSKEAEESVLGALLLDKDAVIAVAEFLLPEDFYDERNKEIYEAIISLYEERTPVDVLTVTERLKKQKNLKKVGGAPYLTDIANKVPTAAHVEHYGKIVKDQAVKRSLMRAASRLVEFSVDESMSSGDLLDKAESEVFSLTQKHLTKAFTSVRDTLAESFDRLDELHKMGDSGLRGIATGFNDLDNALAGLQKSNLVILAARPGVGKCVVGDSLIVDSATGNRLTIEEIFNKKSGKILTLNNNFKLGVTKPSMFVDDGFKPVFEIQTALGNKLEATAIHPLLTIEGWKKLEELKTGMRIATPRKIDIFGKNKWKSYKIKTLAYLLGDGGLTNTSPRFTNGNNLLLSDFSNSIANFDGVITKLEKQSSKKLRTPTVTVVNLDQYNKKLRTNFCIEINKWISDNNHTQIKLAKQLKVSPALVNAWVSGTSLPGLSTIEKLEKLTGGKYDFVSRTNPVTKWLTDLNVMGKLAIKKEIPPIIFTLTKSNIGLFLNRLYACEGSAMPSKGKGTGVISFASSSFNIAEGVKHLLLRFGILANLRTKNIKYKGGYKVAYEVEIRGSDNLSTFINEIGIFGKEKNINKIKKLIKDKATTKNFSKDTLPLGIWKIIENEKKDITWREVYRRMGRPLNHNIHVNKRQLRRETLEEIAKALKSRNLLNLAKGDIYWDKIISIKPVGKKHVYDLTVDQTHNFVANDIIVHNTTLAMNIAQHASVDNKKHVGYFSLEMSKEELVDRLLVNEADIDAWRLKTGKLSEEDFTKLSNAMGVLAEASLYIDDTPALSILEMRTKARRLQVEQGLDMIIVDYLQLARSRNLENRVQEVSEISQGLKNLARELKIPVLALSQLSRGVESRNIKKPQLSDLRESGSIEQDADVVMFLWREDDEKNENIMLDIAKHRNGPLASVPLFFKGDRIKFFSRDTKHSKV